MKNLKILVVLALAVVMLAACSNADVVDSSLVNGSTSFLVGNQISTTEKITTTEENTTEKSAEITTTEKSTSTTKKQTTTAHTTTKHTTTKRVTTTHKPTTTEKAYWCDEGGTHHITDVGDIGWVDTYDEAVDKSLEYISKHNTSGNFRVKQCLGCGLYTATVTLD